MKYKTRPVEPKIVEAFQITKDIYKEIMDYGYDKDFRGGEIARGLDTDKWPDWLIKAASKHYSEEGSFFKSETPFKNRYSLYIRANNIKWDEVKKTDFIVKDEFGLRVMDEESFKEKFVEVK